MRSADLINEIINGIERLVQNIRKLWRSLKMKKNVTL